MGLGLIAGWGMAFYRVFAGQKIREPVTLVIFSLFLYISLVPLLTGIYNGHAGKNIIRDFIPFLFLTLPFLYYLAGYSEEKDLTLIIAALLFVGIISSFQFFQVVLDRLGSTSKWISNMAIGLRGTGGSDLPDFWNIDLLMRDSIMKLYDPASLFAAVYLLCFGFKELLASSGNRLLGLISVVTAGFCTYCFMMIGLRAHSALIFVSFCIFSVLFSRLDTVYRNKLLAIFPVAALCVYPFVKDAIRLMLLKQSTVGTNGKLEEWGAVIQSISASGDYLWGIGWGGLLNNPVTAYKSRFTHSMFSFFLLKTGIIGLVALFSVFAITAFQRRLRPILNSEAKLLAVVSALPPILVGFLFQPSYKMLSFSLVISVLLMALPDKTASTEI